MIFGIPYNLVVFSNPLATVKSNTQHGSQPDNGWWFGQDMLQAWNDEYRKYVKKGEVLSRLENTSTPDQIASFTLTLLQSLQQFREEISAAENIDNNLKNKYLENIGKLIETAGDQHEIFCMVPAARTADGQRKDDLLRMSRLKVKTFYGDYRAWKSWYEQYQTAIHDNKVYRNPQVKFMYLLECLTDEPQELVSGFEVTAENYPKALRALEERYSNPQLTYVAYRKKLEALAPAKDTVASLHTTVNKIRSILSNLRSYGIEEAVDDLRSLVVQKFTTGLVMEAYSFSKLVFACRMEELLQALAERISLREWVETLRAGKKSSDTQAFGTTAMMAGTGQSSSGQASGGKMRAKKRHPCEFCGGSHKADDCRKFPTAKGCKDIIRKNRRCFICLGDGHGHMACPNREKCQHCAQTSHHSSICMVKQVKPAGQQDARKYPKPRMDKSGGTQPGLLEILNAEPGPSRTMGVPGFGSATATSVEVQEATIALVSRINGWKKTVKVLATACLAGQLRVAPSPGLVADLLKSGLQYAEPTLFLEKQPRVELLLGNNLYYDVVKINGNRRLDNGLVLLSSVFGWVPAGRANLDVENLNRKGKQALISTGEIKATVNSDECMTEINTLLQGLWDLETLGIRESEFKDVSARVIDHFRSTCRFENGRYVVCWPWKGSKKDLNIPSNYQLSVARLKGTLRSTSVELLRQCDEKFREQLADGIIEKVTMGSRYPQH